MTAGNAAGLNDAAAAVLLMDPDYAASNGFQPLAAIRSWAAVGVAPRRTGMAPIDAIPKALARAKVDQGDIDLFEINEAFCSVPVAATRALGIDQEICNVNGSGCSLGHPIAATGARMVVTMVHELRRRGARLGCVSMCAGGGMGMAMVVEALWRFPPRRSLAAARERPQGGRALAEGQREIGVAHDPRRGGHHAGWR